MKQRPSFQQNRPLLSILALSIKATAILSLLRFAISYDKRLRWNVFTSSPYVDFPSKAPLTSFLYKHIVCRSSVSFGINEGTFSIDSTVSGRIYTWVTIDERLAYCSFCLRVHGCDLIFGDDWTNITGFSFFAQSFVFWLQEADGRQTTLFGRYA
jgi:hypothetical protein